MEIQEEIESIERGLWEQVRKFKPEEEFDDLAGWVQDPRATHGRLAALHHCDVLSDERHHGPCSDGKSEQGCWGHGTGLCLEVHNSDFLLMHRNIDIIASKDRGWCFHSSGGLSRC